MYPKKMRTLGCIAVAAALLSSGQASARAEYPPMPAPDPDVYLDRSGLNELVLWQAFYGTHLGWTLTTALATDPVRQTAGILIGGAAGIGVPLLVTLDKPVPSGDVVYINQLQRIGIVNGWLTYGLLDPRAGEPYRRRQALLASGNVIGLGAALLTKDALELSPGQASALGSGYFYGMFTGAMLMAMLDVVESDQASFGALLGFSNAGLAAAFVLRDHLDVDRSRMMWTTVGAGVGAGLGAGLGMLLGGEDISPRFIAGTTLAGFWGGAATTFLTIVPPAGYKNRADLPPTSLVAVGEGGSLSVGAPVPTPKLLPPRVAGGSPELAATVSVLEWRSQ